MRFSSEAGGKAVDGYLKTVFSGNTTAALTGNLINCMFEHFLSLENMTLSSDGLNVNKKKYSDFMRNGFAFDRSDWRAKDPVEFNPHTMCPQGIGRVGE